MYKHIQVPAHGKKITINADNSLNVPDEPVIPFIEGDGTGQDITPVMLIGWAFAEADPAAAQLFLSRT